MTVTTRSMGRWFAAMLLILFWSGSASAAPRGDLTPATGDVEGEAVPAAICMGCHSDSSEKPIHGTFHHSDCASCHGPGSQHARAKDKKGTIGFPQTEQCQTCHAKDPERADFAFGHHDAAGVACANCHEIHGDGRMDDVPGMSRLQEDSKVCATCHQDVFARFNMPSHHPVKEGALSCTSCHDPHDGGKLRLADNTAQCTECHQAVRGPHVFEHAPAVEDCANCHQPHGSPNRRLLQVAQPGLCLQCHSLAANRHGDTGQRDLNQRFLGAVLRDCTSCHSQVHGSSHDQHLRY